MARREFMTRSQLVRATLLARIRKDSADAERVQGSGACIAEKDRDVSHGQAL